MENELAEEIVVVRVESEEPVRSLQLEDILSSAIWAAVYLLAQVKHVFLNENLFAVLNDWHRHHILLDWFQVP